MPERPGGGAPREKTEIHGRRRWAAYRRANWLLSGAGVTLALSGVSPHSPEVQAIRRALRAVNVAGGLEEEKKEAGRADPPGEARLGKNAG